MNVTAIRLTFLFTFIAMISVVAVVLYVGYSRRKSSSIKVGDKVTMGLSSREYTVERISTFGLCTLRWYKKGRFSNSRFSNKRGYTTTCGIWGLTLVPEKTEKNTANNDCRKTPIDSERYDLPYVNCPNCGGKFGEDTEQNLMRGTCKCAYCDSVFSMLKR